MIRFCDLSGQITLDDDDFWFAWYDTIIDTFLSFGGSQIWNNWKNFEKDYIEDGGDDISRFKGLFKTKEEDLK